MNPSSKAIEEVRRLLPAEIRANIESALDKFVDIDVVPLEAEPDAYDLLASLNNSP